MLCKLDPLLPVADIPSVQKLSAPNPLKTYKQGYKNQSIAMAVAYLSGHYTLTEVGNEFGVSRTTVSRAVTKYESGCAM
jgi:putative transposase